MNPLVADFSYKHLETYTNWLTERYQARSTSPAMKFTFDNWFIQGTVYLFETPPKSFQDEIHRRYRSHVPRGGSDHRSDSGSSQL